jgi:hypothetical protein
MKVSIGVDPGRSGAIAFLPDKGDPWCIKTSETLRDLRDALYDVVIYADGPKVETNDLFAVLETVHSSPQMGVKSAFTFGQSFGQLESLLVAIEIPFERVRPLKWQTAMQCRSGGDKNVTKAKAQELFPNVDIFHWNADALLLAAYAQRISLQNT